MGFVCGGTGYTGPRAREWANEIISSLLDDEYFDEMGCGYPVLAMRYGTKEKPDARSLVALVQVAQRCCSGCAYEPDKCPIRYWSEMLEVPLPSTTPCEQK